MRLSGLLCLLLALSPALAAQARWTRYVDPFVGTGGHGHTFPGASVPFGMVQLSPDTRLTGWDGCSGHHYSDSVVYGFSHTHLSGTDVSDYGDILFMLTAGRVFLKATGGGGTERGYASRFSHGRETASPGYYAVRLVRRRARRERRGAAQGGTRLRPFRRRSLAGLSGPGL